VARPGLVLTDRTVRVEGNGARFDGSLVCGVAIVVELECTGCTTGRQFVGLVSHCEMCPVVEVLVRTLRALFDPLDRALATKPWRAVLVRLDHVLVVITLTAAAFQIVDIALWVNTLRVIEVDLTRPVVSVPTVRPLVLAGDLVGEFAELAVKYGEPVVVAPVAGT